jgi:hypothetical protein
VAGLANHYRQQREAQLQASQWHKPTRQACFEASNTEECMRASAVQDDGVIMLSVADVSKTFKQVNILKAILPSGSVF